MNYEDYLMRKLSTVPPTGIESPLVPDVPMFEHQEALTTWALKRGRAAIFADTGLGKTRMELVWADVVAKHTAKPALILAPLAVSRQTCREGEDIGIPVTLCRSALDIKGGVNITNYDRLHKFDAAAFGGVVLDESSVIKHHDAKTFWQLTQAFERTPFKLAATATPAPNDWTELATHAEWLGICTRSEMLSEYFTHDGGETSVWRLKRHARKAFWQWVSSWGAMIRKPSDLGFDDASYKLPPLIVHEHVVNVEMPTDGMLFAMEAQTLSERRYARRISMQERVTECADVVNADADEPWVVWCDLNDESKLLTKAIHGAIEITGSDSTDIKERRLEEFALGQHRVLVSKPSICGWGLNWQHAARMAFVGVTDSYEAYYQAVRRCWRFGQFSPVHVHIFASTAEGAIVANLKRKEADAQSMAAMLSDETKAAVMREVVGLQRDTNEYHPSHKIALPNFLEKSCPV